jgi:hypothetical protein
MKKRMPWASPSFDACTSWIYLGVAGASPILSFCPSFISSHHSSLHTLENFLHTKLHTIFISNISVIKTMNPLWFSFNTSLTSNKTLATVTTSFKALSIERTTKEKD